MTVITMETNGLTWQDLCWPFSLEGKLVWLTSLKLSSCRKFSYYTCCKESLQKKKNLHKSIMQKPLIIIVQTMLATELSYPQS